MATNGGDLHPIPKRYQTDKDPFDMEVWDACARLAAETNALDLTQGFADFLPPDHILQAIEYASTSPVAHQEEATLGGHVRLLDAISKLYSPRFSRQIDATNEIIVTPGADGALLYTLYAMLNPGDEVMVFDPCYPSYENFIRSAEAVPVFIPLHPVESSKSDDESEWVLDFAELESKFNKKTKMMILNTPHNPTGKVFRLAELQRIADLCKRYDVLVIADEVYEFLVFSPHQHFKIASLPGMWERTVTISSAGKLLCATGWRLGWAIAPKALADNIKAVKYAIYGSTACVLQEALAQVLEFEMANFNTDVSYLTGLRNHLRPIRDSLVEKLKAVGAKPSTPEAGLFVLVKVDSLAEPLNGHNQSEPLCLRFMKWFAINKGIAVVPACVFFCAESRNVGNNYIRFCYCKKGDTMRLVNTILENW